MAGTDFIWWFTPSRTDVELLEEIFVQRHELLSDILERVRESGTTGSKHQLLLIGPRGIGKTHLISLLHQRITQDPALSAKVRIAWLLEDETITSFVQLLKRIYELLADEYPDEFSRDWLDGVLDRSPPQILRALETRLVEAFHDKTLLLFIENLDLIFQGMGDTGQKQWRSFLQTNPFTTIVATTQRLFAGVQKREQPFFGFFAREHLRPLPAPDAIDLLRRIARHREQADLIAFLATPEGRSRVRALHHLAGGNHRIYIVLSGFITRESLDELTEPFEKMADALTPYYQERMRWLSPQQRQIVEYLCSQEGTCTPKAIARQLLTSENTVGKQLKLLLELGYVLRSPRGRESLYELAEPLMRLASEVKEKRRKPLRLLVSFLRAWYRPEVLPQLLERAGTPSLRQHLQAAIDEARRNPDPRLKVLEDEIDRAREEGRLAELQQLLEDRAHTLGTAEAWTDVAISHSSLSDSAAAIACYDQSLEIDSRNAIAWNGKGYVLMALGRREEAIACYDRSLEIDPRDVAAWNGKGCALHALGRREEAITCYDRALEIDPRDAIPWLNKGQALQALGRREEAIACYDRAPEIDPRFAFAWLNKGQALQALGRREEAIACYDRALEIDPRDAFPWNGKGCALHALGRRVEAIACYDRALEIDPRHVAAWNNKGWALDALGRREEAIACYDRALKIEPRAPVAWTNWGHALRRMGRTEAGRQCYEKVLELDDSESGVLFVRTEALFGLQRWEAGLAVLSEAFSATPGDSTHDVQSIVALTLELSERDSLYRHLGRLIELYASAGALSYLGRGLVECLNQFAEGSTDARTLGAYCDAWQDLGGGHPELEVPLRIFRVGIEYLIRRDERVLLDLVSVERKVLQQALGLDPEDERHSLDDQRPGPADAPAAQGFAAPAGFSGAEFASAGGLRLEEKTT